MSKPQNDNRIIWGLFGTSVVRAVATGTILVFLPVYLYQLSGMWLVIVWFAATRLVDALMMRDYARLIAKMGFKKSVLLGQILWAGVMYCVSMSSQSLWMLVPAGLLVTFAASLYWIPYHLLFMQTSGENFGKRASFLNIFSKWGAAIGPILGGVMAVKMGFASVFWLSGILMALAAIPIILLEPNKLKWDFHLDHYWEKLTGRWFRKDLLAGMGIGMEQAMYDYFWPVFLLSLLGGSYLGLGIYKTVVLTVTTVIEFFVGRAIDHGGTSRLMLMGVMVMMTMWIMRGGFTDPMILLGVDILDGWVGILVFLPFSVYSYRRAVVSDKSLYLVESETASRFGGFLAAVGMGILYALGIGWSGMVGIGIVGMMLMSLQPKIGPRQFLKMMHSRRGEV